jgi:hypothetical protein
MTRHRVPPDSAVARGSSQRPPRPSSSPMVSTGFSESGAAMPFVASLFALMALRPARHRTRLPGASTPRYRGATPLPLMGVDSEVPPLRRFSIRPKLPVSCTLSGACQSGYHPDLRPAPQKRSSCSSSGPRAYCSSSPTLGSTSFPARRGWWSPGLPGNAISRGLSPPCSYPSKTSPHQQPFRITAAFAILPLSLTSTRSWGTRPPEAMAASQDSLLESVPVIRVIREERECVDPCRSRGQVEPASVRRLLIPTARLGRWNLLKAPLTTAEGAPHLAGEVVHAWLGHRRTVQAHQRRRRRTRSVVPVPIHAGCVKPALRPPALRLPSQRRPALGSFDPGPAAPGEGGTPTEIGGTP